MSWIYLLLDFSGRIGRRKFIIGLLPVALLLGGIYVLITRGRGVLPPGGDMVLGWVMAIEAAYFMAALGAKRLHDFGRSNIFLALFFAPLIISALFLFQQKFILLHDDYAQKMAIIIYTLLITTAIVLFLWMGLEMLFRRGDEKANQFGPPPSS